MQYFWFMPLFAVGAFFIWVFYLVVARGLPKVSDRSVSDALAEDNEPDQKPSAPVL
jgi:hypothetical protein